METKGLPAMARKSKWVAVGCARCKAHTVGYVSETLADWFCPVEERVTCPACGVQAVGMLFDSDDQIDDVEAALVDVIVEAHEEYYFDGGAPVDSVWDVPLPKRQMAKA